VTWCELEEKQGLVKSDASYELPVPMTCLPVVCGSGLDKLPNKAIVKARFPHLLK